MDEDKKQKIMIGLIVGCLVLAGIITVVTNLGKGGGRRKRPTGPVTMLCINNKCNADFELSQEELVEQMRQMGDGDFMMMQTPKFICPECNNRSAYRATICGECDTMSMHDNICCDRGYNSGELQHE